MICSKCGRFIEEDSRFCTFCGAPIEVQPPQEPVAEPEAPVEPVTEPETPQEPTAPVEPEPEAAEIPAPELEATVEPEPEVEAEAPAPEPESSPEPAPTPTPEPEIPAQPVPPAPQDPYAPSVPPAPPAPQDPYAPGVPPAPQDPYAPGVPPQGFPPQGVPPQGFSPQGAPAYPEPPQQPKKKKTWLVVLITAIVLLVLCCGLAIAGVVLYMPNAIQNGISDATGDFTWEDGYSDSDSDDNTKPKAAEATDEVIVDDEILTVIVKLGSGEEDEYLESYSVACTVENKTGEALGLYFDDTTEAEGFFERAPMALIYPTGYVEDYPAYETTDTTIVFLDTLLDEKVTNFKGVLVVYDLDTWETIAEYPFNIKEL